MKPEAVIREGNVKKITLDLVVVHGEPRVDSRVISQKLNVQHKATVQLIARHQNRLEKFGLVPFEMEAVKKKRGVKHEKYYLLNESQSIFLLKKALSEGMAGNLFYKDIYKLAKTRIETLAAIHGKVAIPASQIQSSGHSLIGMDR